MAAEQRRALQAMISRAAHYDGMTVDDLARIMRPAIGLTTPQAKANLNFWAAAWKAGAEAGLSQKAAMERANQLAATYAARQHRSRAMNIARTELAAAYNQGAHGAITAAQGQGYIGDCKKTWLTADDERVCESCGALDGESVNMEAMFSNGVYLPPAHPGCRCAVAYEEVAAPLLAPVGLESIGDITYNFVLPSGATGGRVGEWKPIGFDSNQLDKKYGQHVIGRKEFGNITKEEYRDKAMQHMANSEVDSLILKSGHVLKYNHQTNEFGVGGADGMINTYYKPTDKAEYWERQKDRFKEELA